MRENIKLINIKRFKSYIPEYIKCQIGDSFFEAEINNVENISILNKPCKWDGYIAIFCKTGEIEIEVNLKKYTVSANTLFINIPGSIFRISKFDANSAEQFGVLIVGLSTDFVTTMCVDLKKLFNESIMLMTNPIFKLGEDDQRLCRNYLDIIDKLIARKIGNLYEAVATLSSSLLYLVGDIWYRGLDNEEYVRNRDSVRANIIFDQFLKLATKHHTEHRSMRFYAEQLCLTPKYLSKLVKIVSGRSAPNWIDSFVILEAKNLLRYTNITIKELVFKLNFQNQSVFYKFFKAHTGMTPSEYRKS